MTLNRYQHANVKHLIDGYMIPKPWQSSEQGFDSAKEELLINLKKQIQMVEEFTFEDFCKKVK